jgi:PAS domain S-box-containing protein
MPGIDSDRQAPEKEFAPSEFYVRLAQRISEILGILVLLTGIFLMAAWEWNPTIIKLLSPDQLITKFNVALFFALTGLAIWCLQTRRLDNEGYRLTGIFSAVALMLMALLTFCQYIFQSDLGIDQVFFQVPAAYIGNSIPGRMSINTAFCFMLLSGSLLFLSRKKTSLIYVPQILTLVVGVFSLVSLISFCYGAPPFFIGPKISTATTLISSILFPLSCLGILFLRSDKGLIAHTTRDLMGSRILRLMLPVAMCVPVITNFLEAYAANTLHWNGKVSIVLDTVFDIFITSGYIFLLSVLLDRSDFKRKRLELDSMRLKDLVDSADDSIIGSDLSSVIISWNQGAEKMFGYAANEVLGTSVNRLIPKDRTLEERLLIDEIRKGRVVKHFETFRLKKDGGQFAASVTASPIKDTSGEIIGLSKVIRDVTEQKQARDKVLESEERFRRLFESSMDAYMTNEPPTWKFTSGNSAACKMFGAANEAEFVSLGPTDLSPERQPDGRLSAEKSKEMVEKAMREGTHFFEWTHKRLNGQEFFSTVLLTRVRIKGRDILLGTVRDITHQKQVEQELIHHKEHLESIVDERTKLLQVAKATAERALAVKDDFTSTVSHELRTPLAAIKSSIDILDTEAPGALTGDQKVFIKRVKSNIDRLARLINDVLDLTKLDAGRMKMNLTPLRVESLVQEVVETQQPLAKSKGLKITTEFGKDLPVLVADKDRLIQVLNNLINNALKFTKEGMVVIAVHADDQSMAFRVQDTGIGIKEENFSNLFQKFQQVGGPSQQVAGSGLGLAICKLIIEKHRGRIWVDSRFGAGSSFNFNIPIRKEKRILVVDDDEVTLEVVKLMLEGQKVYEVESASDGFKAGQKYYEFSPQLIILDINLPKINGLEVCARIKNDPKTKHTKIIMISSFDSDQKKKEAWDAGADDIVGKPINSHEMIAKVRKLI